MIKFLITGDVKAPKRNDGDAGFDFFMPNESTDLISYLKDKNGSVVIVKDGEVDKIEVMPHKSILIPTYVRSLVPHNVALVAMNKSGIATKKHFDVGACVVDHSYEGIIHMHVTNTSDEVQYIEFGSKLIQFVPLVIDDEGYEIVEGKSEVEFYADHKSDRGTGGFGSTGLK